MNLAEAYKKAKKSGTNPEIEHILSQDAHYSFFYAKEVIKGRWELGENAISQDIYFSFLYAKDVLKNKLPEIMHNKMIAYSIKDPKKYFTNQYFEFIKIYG